MRNILACLLSLSLSVSYAQMKYLGEPVHTERKHIHNVVDPRPERTAPATQTNVSLTYRDAMPFPCLASVDGVSLRYDVNGQIISIDESQPTFQIDATRGMEVVTQYLASRAEITGLDNPAEELHLVRTITDGKGNTHYRFQQVLDGYEVYGAELIVHSRNTFISGVTGRWWQTPHAVPAELELSIEQVKTRMTEELQLKPIPSELRFLVPEEQMTITPILYPDITGRYIHAFHVQVYPDVSAHWHYFLRADNGAILAKHADVCRIAHVPVTGAKSTECSNMEGAGIDAVQTTCMDGDVSLTDQDLTGNNRAIHTYQVGSNFFMIDASRPMYNAQQSNMPDEPLGALWTLNANGTSPQNNNFMVSHNTTSNNNWTPLQVSAHWNSTVAYEYFRTTHGRNSINGTGGNIISLINVRDENSNEMDNAFWSGYAMFYGNGDQAFSSPLAKGLDVAGHEMSHGVVQNTANLEYMGQSGALNESFADIFGSLIDRDDWLIGEDVVNTSVYFSGALRSMSDPHNGGGSASTNPGWQPKHMNEFVNLPNTPEGDNGGVHVNSGIPNHAFFLFATSVGKDVAEDVYYHALSTYLVKSSQFVDARNAVVQSAKDLFPGQPQIATAAENAFSSVGIGAGQGGNYEEDIDVNPGGDFVLLTNNAKTLLYVYNPVSGDVTQLNAPAPRSRPSISDDGTIAVYVASNKTLKAIIFDWSGSTLDYQVVDLESTPQPIWRNIAISKDGERIAYTTDDLENFIYVYDFQSNQEEAFELYIPTSGGIVTEGVLYADVLEWDFSGEYLMYDALNEIDGTFGDGIRYWDISFLDAWNQQANNFSSGQVGKLFTSLPENVSVGNATFSKNSPYVIAFDYLEETTDFFGNTLSDYRLLTANIQSGRVVSAFENDTLAFPTYSRLDNFILFDTKDPDNQSAVLIAFIRMQKDDKLTPVPNSATILIPGGSLATWASTGERVLTQITGAKSVGRLTVSPNPAAEYVEIRMPENAGSTTVYLTDISGKRLTGMERNGVDGASVRLDVRAIPSGVYVIEVLSEAGYFTAPVMISR